MLGVWCDIWMNYSAAQYIDGLVQGRSISSALAMDILQSCTKSSILSCYIWAYF